MSRPRGTPLDPAHPMWQFHLVEHFDGGSALVARIHHCYADGIALVQVILSMTDAAAEGSAGDGAAAQAQAERRARRRPAHAVRGSRSPMR